MRAGLPVLLLYVGKLIIDEVVRLVDIGGGDLEYLWILVAIELGLALLSDLLGRGVALVESLLGDLFTNETSVRLMRHAAQLDLAHFEDADFYDKLERARRQTTGRIVLLSQVMGQLQDFVTIVTFAAGLLVMAPWLILLLVIALVPGFLGEAHFNSLSYSLMYAWTPERRELDYLRYIGASDETAKEIKIFGLADFLADRYRSLADGLYEANKKLATRRAAWGSLLAAIGSIGYYAAYAIIIWRTVAGQFSIGDLTFLAGSFARLRSLLEGMLERFTSIAERSLFLKDLFEFFDIRPEIAAPDAPVPFPRPIRNGFEFENVGFRYPGTDRWVLRDLTFSLEAGEKLALVGENGAGKTTLVKLLARLYDPTEGRILLDGRDLREYDVDELRRNVGVIFQDFVHYSMTASDNLAVGRIDERSNRPRIEDAAHRSLADEIIERLPSGYDQMVGRRFEDGVDLSGGEWQKIALGRAYMRDAQLLILDEPTAALDARAEYEVFQRFTELTSGKTAVLISHRFSTVRMADRILVLEHGNHLESGTHEELLVLGGRYAELFNLQAAGYR
jgi:ATP-binding cassette subfamily B protein